MIEDQAFAAIRNAIRLENLSRDLAAKVTPELAMIFKEVREIVKTMPPGALEREIRYKQLRLQLASMFTGPNAAFYRELKQGLDGEVLRQVQWAEDWLRIATRNNPEQEVIANIPRDGVSLPVVDGIGSRPPIASVQFTRTQLVAITEKTEVLGKRLEQLFGTDEGASVWIRDNIKQIDKTVKQGFLLGETNEEIANRLPGMGQLAVTRNRAIARTAVMDMSQRAHETFWDANNNFDWVDPETGETREVRLIELWEFDATFDYRVCPQCYPYDGKRVKERSDLPSVPVHPNCRCRILPLTATALALEKEDIKNGMIMSMVQVGDPKAASGTVRPYKTKARFRKTVKGKQKTVTMPKYAQDVEVPRGERPTMGFFMGKATADTRRAVLGATRAKEFEYLTSDNRGPKRTDLDEVLRQVTLADADSLAKAQRARGRRRK